MSLELDQPPKYFEIDFRERQKRALSSINDYIDDLPDEYLGSLKRKPSKDGYSRRVYSAGNLLFVVDVLEENPMQIINGSWPYPPELTSISRLYLIDESSRKAFNIMDWLNDERVLGNRDFVILTLNVLANSLTEIFSDSYGGYNPCSREERFVVYSKTNIPQRDFLIFVSILFHEIGHALQTNVEYVRDVLNCEEVDKIPSILLRVPFLINFIPKKVKSKYFKKKMDDRFSERNASAFALQVARILESNGFVMKEEYRLMRFSRAMLVFLEKALRSYDKGYRFVPGKNFSNRKK